MKLRIVAGDSVKDKNNRDWIWDRSHNLIGFLDTENYTFHVVGKYEEDLFLGFDLYLMNETIFITCQNKIQVLKYDINKKFFTIYKADLQQKATQYYSAKLSETKIIMIAYELKFPALIFDMLSGQFEEVFWMDDSAYADKVIGRLEDSDDEILIPVEENEEILVINKENLKYSKIQLHSINKIGVVHKNGFSDLWITSSDGNTLVRYIQGKEYRIEINDTNAQNAFSKLVRYGNMIVAIPRCEESIYLYDEKGRKGKIIKLPLSVNVQEGASSLFWNCIEKEDKLILLPWRYPQIVEIDLNTYVAKNNKVNVYTKELCKHIKTDLAFENDLIEVTCLIEFIKTESLMRDHNYNNTQRIGSAIKQICDH